MRRDIWGFLFVFGLVLFSWPFIVIFGKSLAVYFFLVWAAFIGLIFLAIILSEQEDGGG